MCSLVLPSFSLQDSKIVSGQGFSLMNALLLSAPTLLVDLELLIQLQIFLLLFRENQHSWTMLSLPEICTIVSDSRAVRGTEQHVGGVFCVPSLRAVPASSSRKAQQLTSKV